MWEWNCWWNVSIIKYVNDSSDELMQIKFFLILLKHAKGLHQIIGLSCHWAVAFQGWDIQIAATVYPCVFIRGD
jgi:hypothetical protein